MALTKVIKETDEIIRYVAEQYYKGIYNTANLLPEIYKLVSDELILNLKDNIDPLIYNTDLYNQLESNLKSFAAGKNKNQLDKMISQLLINDDIDDFVKKSRGVNYLFNDTYLKTEMNFINNSIQSINKWNSVSKLKEDDYMIQYIATKDELTRDNHMMLNGTILPKSDPFWQNYLPPWDYNCRCTYKAVRFDPEKMGTQLQESQELSQNIGNNGDFKLRKGISNNPSQSAEFFTNEHPYIKNNDVEIIKRTLEGLI